ncbi:hypothetical protein [Acidaminococcus fermentans]|uniref:hypothetical protein n=1 Tax=Acidaminococcus fermentans TaxID=905 RepID=UPI001160D640|nr:hypothetical protein [Acidaminococcus fermentans]
MFRHCLDCNKDIYEDTDFCPDCGGYLVIEKETALDRINDGLGLPKNFKNRSCFSLLFGGIKAYSGMFVYPFVVAISATGACYQHDFKIGVFGCIEVFFATLWIMTSFIGYKTYNEYAFRLEFTCFCFFICLVCRLIRIFL